MIHNLMEIEAFDSKIQSIKDELNSLSNNVLSANERINKIKELQEKTKQTKEELENEMNNRTDAEKEKAEACLNTLNELISFELALYTTATATDTQPEQTSGDGNKKGGFLSRTKDWIGNQWSDIWDKNKWKDESGKNLLRTAGFVATGGGIIALAYGGIKRLVEKRRAKKAAETETQGQPGQESRPGFWKRPFGRFLKRLGIGTAVAGGTYVLGKRFNWRDRLKQRGGRRTEDNTQYSDDIDSNYGESELAELRGFETECKSLKEQADKCRKSAKENGMDIDNAKKYNHILNKALHLQELSVNIYEKIFGSNESSKKTRNETENLKSKIDSYIGKIYAMKNDIVPEGADLGDDEDFERDVSPDGDNDTGNGTSDNSETETGGEQAPEKFESVSGSVLTKATMNFFEKTKQDIGVNLNGFEQGVLNTAWEKGLLFSNPLRTDIEAIVSSYFSQHKILKKSASKKMIVEIDDTNAFCKMVKDIFEAIPSVLKSKLPFDQKCLDNLGNTLRESDAKSYENIIFEQFGSIIRNAVTAERGTMTVQSFYDNIKKYYPNKNETQVDNDLKNSKQAEVDIKSMNTSRTHKATQA